MPLHLLQKCVIFMYSYKVDYIGRVVFIVTPSAAMRCHQLYSSRSDNRTELLALYSYKFLSVMTGGAFLLLFLLRNITHMNVVSVYPCSFEPPNFHCVCGSFGTAIPDGRPAAMTPTQISCSEIPAHLNL